jgi:hypothetical protein
VRFFRRMLVEHRRLPPLVRGFRIVQALSWLAIVCLILVGLTFRPPLAVMNALMLLPLIGVFGSLFAIGLLTWRNYQRTAEIYAANVRGRGLDSIGIGWLADTGTMRALGVGKVLFVLVGILGLTIQAIWSALR